MDILLDSHILLWALTDDPRLSEKARRYICNENSFVFYSAVTIWELVLKHQLHPENVTFTAEELISFCDEAGFESVDLTVEHILMLETLKRQEDAPRHKDPFDRMLIAQAKAENMIFLTHDSLVSFYKEDCIVIV